VGFAATTGLGADVVPGLGRFSSAAFSMRLLINAITIHILGVGVPAALFVAHSAMRVESARSLTH
jgi:hypothetical protein